MHQGIKHDTCLLVKNNITKISKEWSTNHNIEAFCNGALEKDALVIIVRWTVYEK